MQERWCRGEKRGWQHFLQPGCDAKTPGVPYSPVERASVLLGNCQVSEATPGDTHQKRVHFTWRGPKGGLAHLVQRELFRTPDYPLASAKV